jgi:hypothetical protein
MFIWIINFLGTQLGKALCKKSGRLVDRWATTKVIQNFKNCQTNAGGVLNKPKTFFIFFFSITLFSVHKISF